MKTRKARKEHNCTLCNKPINKGEQYKYQRITPWDHAVNEYFFDYKTHLKCDKIWQKHGDERDWEFPDDWEYFTEGTL